MPRLSVDAIEELAFGALVASRTSEVNARAVARSIAAAEADAIPSHGLLRLPTYCRHALSGKVDGLARPMLTGTGPASFRADARNGFAHPAIELVLVALSDAARARGVAAASVFNSYNSGVMGHHVEHLAVQGLVALGFSNAPAVIAPWGGTRPRFGTNPIAFAAPSGTGEALVIDQACSVVARGEVMLRAQRGEAIPPGWGFDSSGQPTTEPNAILNGGSMAPAGDYKGATLALMVEVLAAALTGAASSANAGSLTIDDGKPAGLGQMFIALDPGRFSDSGFESRTQAILDAMLEERGVRIPGARRFAARKLALENGVDVDDSLLRELEGLARS